MVRLEALDRVRKSNIYIGIAKNDTLSHKAMRLGVLGGVLGLGVRSCQNYLLGGEVECAQKIGYKEDQRLHGGSVYISEIMGPEKNRVRTFRDSVAFPPPFGFAGPASKIKDRGKACPCQRS